MCLCLATVLILLTTVSTDSTGTWICCITDVASKSRWIKLTRLIHFLGFGSHFISSPTTPQTFSKSPAALQLQNLMRLTAETHALWEDYSWILTFGDQAYLDLFLHNCHNLPSYTKNPKCGEVLIRRLSQGFKTFSQIWDFLLVCPCPDRD